MPRKTIEERREYERERKKRPERILYMRSWRKGARNIYNKYRESASVRKLEFSISFEEFKCFWGSSCYYCKHSIKTIGLDRVDNNIGYTKENIVPCCKICNFMKGQLDKNEFIDRCRLVATSFVCIN